MKGYITQQSGEGIYNFLKLSDTVAAAGQPTENHSAIKSQDIRVVVNLALPDSPNALPDEKKVI